MDEHIEEPIRPGVDRRAFLKTSAAAAALAAIASARRSFAQEVADLGSPVVDPERLAREYDLAPDVLYLNHASIGTIPRKVQDARIAYLRTCETNPWLYMWGGAWDEALRDTRAQVAAFLGCHADEIAIQHNTTEGFNLLAQGLPLSTEDEVVFSSLNHAGASKCFEHIAKTRGYRVRRFDFPVADAMSMSAADVVAVHVDALSDRTKLLVLPEIDNMIGLRHPVREIAAAARKRGVEIVAVDGAQAVGMRPVDVCALGVDVYCTSPHKWLQAPKGLGVAYIRREVQDRLRPMWVTWGQDRWPTGARRFEDYGTRNLAEALALGDAIRFQRALGSAAKEARLETLHARFRARVDATKGIRWRSPTAWPLGASLYAIELENHSAPAVAKRLFEKHGIVVRPFGQKPLNTLRVSPNLTCRDTDIDRFFRILGSALA